MTSAKEFLNRGFRIDKRINSKLDQIARLKELAVKTSVTLSDMPGDPNRDRSKMEEIIVKVVMLENEINDDIDELLELNRKITQAVGTVTDPQESLVLSRRYLNYWKWEDIAADMDCSVRNIHILHSKALNDVVVPEE